ncbi:MAG: hypothetical protein IPG89_06670 [Bacteroidetes bacterium]|nr:hypothetical protein [Bacteroidota bacterium]
MGKTIDLKKVINEVFKLRLNYYNYTEAIFVIHQYRNILNFEYFDILANRKFKIFKIEVVPVDKSELEIYKSYRKRNCTDWHSYNLIENHYDGFWRITCIIDEEYFHERSIEEVIYYLNLKYEA